MVITSLNKRLNRFTGLGKNLQLYYANKDIEPLMLSSKLFNFLLFIVPSLGHQAKFSEKDDLSVSYARRLDTVLTLRL